MSPPHRLLTDLTRHLVRREIDKASAILEGGVTCDQALLTLVEKHQLGGYLYVLVRNTPLETRFRQVSAVDLEASYFSQVKRAERNISLAADIRRRFEQASLPFLTLKGLYQAQRFSGDVRNRFMWDLDILVRPCDLQAAIEHVQDIGLQPCSTVNFDARQRFWGIHAVEFQGEAGKVDIHVSLRNLQGIRLEHDAIWDNAQHFHVDGITLPTLSDEDTLLTAVLGMGSDIQRGASNLRKIWDIYLMLVELDSRLDWEAFCLRREREGSLKLALNVFSFIGNLLGVTRDWPELAKVMEPRRQLLLITGEGDARTVFNRKRGDFANRVLYSRLLNVSPVRYWSRWLLTLPVRYLHYQGTGK